MQYRRAKTNGATYFFTLVTFNREKILCAPENISLLRQAFKNVLKKYPFDIDAIVILPDHLHCIWTLPCDDHDFSTRWRLIKNQFTRKCQQKYKLSPPRTRQNKKEQGIWQRRFWEHQIRNEKDYSQHVEYIHYNPVKHGLAPTAIEWPHSSFHNYVRKGLYDSDWGENSAVKFDSNTGKE